MPDINYYHVAIIPCFGTLNILICGHWYYKKGSIIILNDIFDKSVIGDKPHSPQQGWKSAIHTYEGFSANPHIP